MNRTSIVAPPFRQEPDDRRDAGSRRSLGGTRWTLAAGMALVLLSRVVAQTPEGGKDEAREETGDIAATEAEPEFSLKRHLLESSRLLGDLGGVRTRLEDHGLNLSLYYNHLYGVNARGGANTSNAQENAASVDFFAQSDFEKMGLWSGGTALLQVKSNHGRGINPDVGALSAPHDDADFDEWIYIDQLYYQQGLFENRISFRIGYLDQQTILDRNAYANSEDTQFLSTFLDNNNAILPLKIGLGATLWVRPTQWLELILGTADADNEILVTGFDTAFDDFDSLMAYFESNFKLELPSPRGDLPGNYRFGVFHDPRKKPIFGRVDSLGRPKLDRGHVGCYVSFDHLVYREQSTDRQGLGVFARGGYRDETMNAVAYFWSLGLQYQGVLPGRDTDAVGLAVYQAIASERLRDKVSRDFRRETGVELYYRIQVTPWLAVTPDVQFIEDPGGRKSARNALVFGLRGRITF